MRRSRFGVLRLDAAVLRRGLTRRSTDLCRKAESSLGSKSGVELVAVAPRPSAHRTPQSLRDVIPEPTPIPASLTPANTGVSGRRIGGPLNSFVGPSHFLSRYLLKMHATVPPPAPPGTPKTKPTMIAVPKSLVARGIRTSKNPPSAPRAMSRRSFFSILNPIRCIVFGLSNVWACCAVPRSEERAAGCGVSQHPLVGLPRLLLCT